MPVSCIVHRQPVLTLGRTQHREKRSPDCARGLCRAQGDKVCSLIRVGHQGAEGLEVSEVLPWQELQVCGGAVAEADLSLMSIDVEPVHMVACASTYYC